VIETLSRILRQKGERHGSQQAHERGQMMPVELFVQIRNRKGAEDGDGDDLLHDFEFRGGIDRVAPAVGRHLQEVFKERDAPARDDDEQQRLALEFQMAIPRECHEYVRAGQQHDGQPAR